MKYTFTTKKIPLNDSIKEYAEKRISKLDRYFKTEADAKVIFSVEKDNRCTVEITIRGENTLFRAQEEAADGNMRGAIDASVGYIDRQIKKNKTRLEKRLRQGAFDMPDNPEIVKEETSFDIIRTKHFAVKPMTTDEAILQMNLLNHSFFVFRDAETNALSIVYHRNNAGYGLIETEDVQ